MAILEFRRKRLEPSIEKKLLKKAKEMDADKHWIFENKENLIRTYPNQYIAVKNKKVEFNGKAMTDIIIKIKTSDKKVEDFVVEYVGKKATSFFL